MPRLPRPHVPLEVRCRVVLRQLGEMWPEAVIEQHRASRGLAWAKGSGPSTGLRALLDDRLKTLAELLDCDVTDLRLDHNPALGAREKVIKRGVHVGYVPDANDPAHLIYREKHAHHIKTNVRGDGAQHPDRVLIKRERRRCRKSANKSKPKRKWRVGKRWKRQPIKGGSRWPAGRKMASRPFGKSSG